MKEKIIEYLNETIVTKKSMRKQIDKLMETIKEKDIVAKANKEQADLYRNKLKLERRKRIELEKEIKEMKQNV